MRGGLLLVSGMALSLSLGAQDTTATKAALLAADRTAAMSVEALERALARDASVLLQDMPVLRGREEFRRVITSMAAAPSGGAAWVPIHAVASRGGDFGCTTGVWTLPEADANSPATGRYANCWRQEHGQWMLIAHTRSYAPATVRSLPDSLPGAPGSTGATSWRLTGATRAMNAADRAFARVGADSGPAKAFSSWIADDGMLLADRAAPPRGPDDARKWFANFPTTARLEWEPIDALARASRSGDLGFTIGEAQVSVKAGDVAYRKYMTVWRRETGGAYRFVFDIGSNQPAPAK